MVQPLECSVCQLVTHRRREAKNSGFVQRDCRPYKGAGVGGVGVLDSGLDASPLIYLCSMHESTPNLCLNIHASKPPPPPPPTHSNLFVWAIDESTPNLVLNMPNSKNKQMTKKNLVSSCVQRDHPLIFLFFSFIFAFITTVDRHHEWESMVGWLVFPFFLFLFVPVFCAVWKLLDLGCRVTCVGWTSTNTWYRGRN